MNSWLKCQGGEAGEKEAEGGEHKAGVLCYKGICKICLLIV